MHTDTIFYQIFLTFHTLLFEILGEPPENAKDYKFTSVFSQLSRQEIEAMFLVSDIKQTRVYQEAKQEGRQEGRQEGKKDEATNLLLRILSKRFGKLEDSYTQNINSLNIEQLEKLGEELLDFTDINDLETWLKSEIDK